MKDWKDYFNAESDSTDSNAQSSVFLNREAAIERRAIGVRIFTNFLEIEEA